ncbi:MAG: thioredoxin [Actinomycetales bacterium]
MATQIIQCPSCGAKNRVPNVSSGHPRCAKCHTDLPWLVNATDADFDAVVGAKPLVLVDLWAPWCGPCRMVAPVLEQLSAELAGRLKVVKVNVDTSPQVSRRFEASSIPMLLLMDGGKVVDKIVGAQPKPVLQQRIDAALSLR